MFFFKTATLLIAGAVSFCGAQLPTGWTSCGDKTDLLTVSKFTFTPPPPLIGGTNVTGALLGHLSAPVAQGTTVTLIAKLGVITLLSEEYDLCELGAKYGTPCPIAAGNINIAITAQVPSAVPSIQVTAFVLGTDADGNQIMCLEGPMTLKAGHAYEPPSQPIESLPSPEIVHVEISSSN